ncbi:hypothetical protein HK098_006716 [Nowakowskiella sp. JEL0407]|nr:hypothetical protein HK098_006716 [Nowakowskiella sp. JEL0407]
MQLSVFLPPSAATVPVLFFLSGLTCNEVSTLPCICFISNSLSAGAIKYAAKHGIALICPDTSPRGLNIDSESESWDFGLAASFYVDATTEKWAQYKMYTYITKELMEVVFGDGGIQSLDKERVSIFGHSMGGHGALMVALRNAGMFKSVSAFAPIANPIKCPWGEKAFSGYLGQDREQWKLYDSTELVKSYSGPKLPILIDQGSEDNFLKVQLLPENFVGAATLNSSIDLEFRVQDGYDHSYWFIQTFIGEF